MIEASRKLSATETIGITRAFTQTLNLINAAEVHHRIRRLRAADIKSNRVTPLPMKEDSIAGTIDAIIASKPGEDAKEVIYQKLLKQKVEFVLTAHPTEVNRRTLLRKYRSISESLATLDRKDLTPYERSQCMYTLKREIASIWGSDEIRRQKPSPQQEARGGLAILESVLWDAVPSYLRKLNAQCILSLGELCSYYALSQVCILRSYASDGL
jgi:phosphoenolpyruvate carboxylase